MFEVRLAPKYIPDASKALFVVGEKDVELPKNGVMAVIRDSHNGLLRVMEARGSSRALNGPQMLHRLGWTLPNYIATSKEVTLENISLVTTLSRLALKNLTARDLTTDYKLQEKLGGSLVMINSRLEEAILFADSSNQEKLNKITAINLVLGKIALNE